MSEDQLLDALRLSMIAGVGPRIQQTLLERFGTVRGVLEATANELRDVPGIGPKLSAAILNGRESNAAESEWARCREMGVQLLVRGTEQYPPRLAEICDPPAVLYCHGDLEPRDALAVAIVGSRHCTLYGQQQAERLGGSLARAGMTVVSGLARGIDGAAHRGALAAGGRTIGVLGTGLANIYPPEHGDLAVKISRQGAVVSEAPLDQAPVPGIFPQRNRIISGLSLGVIIIEASQTSGSLHTARHALEQGREVFAVPGRIDSRASDGCHQLIRDGATLIRRVDDVLEALGPLTAAVQVSPSEKILNPRELTLNDQERQILNTLDHEALHIEDIVRATNMEAGRVLQTLTVLEMKRLVRRLPGGHVSRM